jgi:hypothetical protein
MGLNSITYDRNLPSSFIASVISPEGVLEYAGSIDSDRIAPDIYRQTGLFIVRRAIRRSAILEWQNAWSAFRATLEQEGRTTDPFNAVVVQEATPPLLADIHRSPDLLDLMQTLYADLALFTQRFVIKDARSRGPVFLHHDYGYDAGWPEKTSVFVPLSRMTPENGGLSFYLGTHLLGYLGDVGELDPAVLDPAWPIVSPSVEPGDVVLMHECTWHASGPHVSGDDRILVQITYQPASDPSSIAHLRGTPGVGPRLGDTAPARCFKRSRSTRLRELQATVDRLGQSNS